MIWITNQCMTNECLHTTMRLWVTNYMHRMIWVTIYIYIRQYWYESRTSSWQINVYVREWEYESRTICIGWYESWNIDIYRTIMMRTTNLYITHKCIHTTKRVWFTNDTHMMIWVMKRIYKRQEWYESRIYSSHINVYIRRQKKKNVYIWPINMCICQRNTYVRRCEYDSRTTCILWYESQYICIFDDGHLNVYTRKIHVYIWRMNILMWQRNSCARRWEYESRTTHILSYEPRNTCAPRWEYESRTTRILSYEPRNTCAPRWEYESRTTRIPWYESRNIHVFDDGHINVCRWQINLRIWQVNIYMWQWEYESRTTRILWYESRNKDIFDDGHMSFYMWQINASIWAINIYMRQWEYESRTICKGWFESQYTHIE